MSAEENDEQPEEATDQFFGAENAVDEVERHVVLRERWDRRSAEKLWLVSYSDFMTIMMIFFLAMFGYSHMVQVKRERQRVPLNYPEFAKLVEEMKKKLGDQVHVLDDVDKVTVELGEGILFPSGSAILNSRAVGTLHELASTVSRVDGDIIVEGHTDDVRIVSGQYKTNWELSAARAFSVVDQFSQAGLPPARLAAWGFGENRPVVKNEGEDSRLRNRRIDIVILKRKPNQKT